MRNHEVTNVQPLLNEQGNLAEPGWSRKLVQQYDRTAIKALPFRIKEWDYYLVMSQEFAVCMTVSDMGYMGLESVTFLDFTKPYEHTEGPTVLFPMGSIPMPRTATITLSSYSPYGGRNRVGRTPVTASILSLQALMLACICSLESLVKWA